VDCAAFDEFQESLGIARNVLTDRLSRLVEEGFLNGSVTASALIAWSIS
jgi:DNA-binding HxlR family transcriptional regulator